MINLEKELDKIFADFLHSSFETRQVAVQAAAEHLKAQLEANAPKKTGQFAQKFIIKTKYPDHRYIGNSSVVNIKGGKNGVTPKKNIPLINVLEYSEKHGNPFVRTTFDANENQLFQIIKSKL